MAGSLKKICLLLKTEEDIVVMIKTLILKFLILYGCVQTWKMILDCSKICVFFLNLLIQDYTYYGEIKTFFWRNEKVIVEPDLTYVCVHMWFYTHTHIHMHKFISHYC